ncbi:MAG: hypothetical protein KHX11_20040 [Bacteroides cellulosilyticus]|uniref:hypothetical protein n=1 Tax=Bacteroides cellulosilyticus TaxID=246787 RepID=UPI0029551B7C|nr:hypothetical protein [Bacteroides cellulosilyticus]MBS5701318.1 hypothetical protein [Bacteroides cellulosilyticus]MDV7047562.1 hypothetical protein [Bacteroides cellulosilyticus]
MNKPKVIEKFADNGEHSHWELIDSDTGIVLWSEMSPEEEIIEIEGYKFRRGDIYDIYECERDKRMFLNREAGFIVKTSGDKNHKPQGFRFGEPISYESTSYDIYEKKDKWEQRMNKAIDLWKNSPK